MSDILCGYKGDRAAALMEYLYDEATPQAREDFERHLATCARCRTELNGLGGVRAQLASWAPPEPGFAVAGRRTQAIERPAVITPEPAGDPVSRPSWRTIPAWAQAAAAVLILGVSAGIANLDVHYDARNGLNIRTGWSRPAATAGSQATVSGQAAADPISRDELVALEQRLRGELRTMQTVATRVMPKGTPAIDVDVMRRVRTIVEESERRQQRELALRVAEVLRDVSGQRNADLRRIEQNLGMIEDRTGVAIMKNRQMVDYYIQRASQRP